MTTAAARGQTPGAAQSTVEGHRMLNQLSGRMGAACLSKELPESC